MHHKRGKPKNSRSGCLMCKSHKMNGAKPWDFNRGFAKLRDERHARTDLSTNQD